MSKNGRERGEFIKGEFGKYSPLHETWLRGDVVNRKTAQEDAEDITYEANDLNQYTDMTTDETSFIPECDWDGKSPDGCKGDWTNREACLPRRGELPMGRRRINQTRIKTSTGIWTAGYIRTTYAYAPYGAVTEEGDVTQPLQWSSEYADPELGLVYYNYRYYNTMDGRWNQRDLKSQLNLLQFCQNNPLNYFDHIGKANKAHAICDEYKETSCKNSCGEVVDDPYTQEAKLICHDFVDMYAGSLMENNVSCVAACLVEQERNNRPNDDCDERNYNRLKNHFSCYVNCMFIPYKWLPEKGEDVGVMMLLPSLWNIIGKSLDTSFEYTGRALRGKYARYL